MVAISEYEYTTLNWKEENLDFPNMVRISTIADGSCFFHAISKSFYTPYRLGHINGIPLDKKIFIKNLRKDISKKLSEKIDIFDENSLTYYESISNGELPELSKIFPELKLKNMEEHLDSNEMIDNSYIEFVSELINKNIFILDMKKKDVYPLGTELKSIYKNRPSIVLLYYEYHFELVGILDKNSEIETLFEFQSKFIQTILNRFKDLIKN